jgi:hypothetical protein
MRSAGLSGPVRLGSRGSTPAPDSSTSQWSSGPCNAARAGERDGRRPPRSGGSRGSCSAVTAHVILETKWLCGRSMAPSGLDPFVAYRAHPDVARYQTRENDTAEQGRALIAASLRSPMRSTPRPRRSSPEWARGARPTSTRTSSSGARGAASSCTPFSSGSGRPTTGAVVRRLRTHQRDRRAGCGWTDPTLRPRSGART